MADINMIDLRRIDTGLLLVFLGLMRHRKAGVVADEMGLTQPAISHALKRMRSIWGDPLFLRQPQGLEPTAVALALEPRVRQIVDLLGETLRGPEAFDPATSPRTLRIAAYDYELATILPPLLAQLAAGAPAMTVQALPLQREAALAALADGAIDLALGFFDAVAEPFLAAPLHDETYRVTARAGHPLLGSLTPASYAEARHLLVAPRGDVRGIVDQALALRGLRRQVAAAVPLFFPALATLADSSMVATLPTRVVERFAGRFGLDSRPLPFEVPSFPVLAVRHRRDARSPMLDWVLAQLR
jgi:DNA-binding transcriptional LysR family regulator